MAAVGSVAFAVMMIIVVVDVCGRYFFKHPLKGATELIGILLIIGATWGMGYCQFLQSNIRIDVLFNKFSPRIQSICLAVGFVICGAVAALLAWRAFFKMDEYIVVKLGTKSDILNMPIWPFLAMMAIGFAWLCFIFVAQFIRSVPKVFRR